MARHFLIDTDTASDDAVALVMAMQVPDVQIEAITIVAGNVPVDQGVQNALYTVELGYLIVQEAKGNEQEPKWGAPTFIYKGNLATFNPRAKKFVNLTFHTGALISDPEGVLEGDAKEARVFRVKSGEELSGKKAGLEMVVKNWIQLKDQ